MTQAKEMYDRQQAESEAISGAPAEGQDGALDIERARMHRALDELLDRLYRRRNCIGERGRER
jgi:hypothetical protein